MAKKMTAYTMMLTIMPAGPCRRKRRTTAFERRSAQRYAVRIPSTRVIILVTRDPVSIPVLGIRRIKHPCRAVLAGGTETVNARPAKYRV
jgi:hypothetical protein